MTYKIKDETPPHVLKQFEEDRTSHALEHVYMPMTAYIRLADQVAEAMQRGLLQGREYEEICEAMKEVDSNWSTR